MSVSYTHLDVYKRQVYTQTTDVEIEVNGLMTYDRKVIKLDEQKLKRANTEICESLKMCIRDRIRSLIIIVTV